MSNIIPYTPSRLASTVFIKKKLRKFLSRRVKTIDIGCGRLFFYYLLKEAGIKGSYLGIDLNPFTTRIENSGLSVRTKKIDFLKFKTKEKYDLAACLWTLEHIKDDKAAITKISGLLKKNGILILAVPSIWTWPFEFGRHGFHYYNKKKIISMAKNSDLTVIDFYKAGGLLGFFFMIFYNWPRYLILVPSVFIYKIFVTLGFTKITWADFSKNLISFTWYSYHRSKLLVSIHNLVISVINHLDRKMKLFPASYVLILRKK